jgi:hypothetical protein
MGIYRIAAWAFTGSLHGHLPDRCMGVYRIAAWAFTGSPHGH